ncbi:hypothetical protein EV426DRAFT_243955 [Tirmania nivea]|nr:hypothetical protein EV426DRAFT_243955 [Tirmania nivea]
MQPRSTKIYSRVYQNLDCDTPMCVNVERICLSINLIVQCFALCYSLLSIPYFVLHALFVHSYSLSAVTIVAALWYCLRSCSVVYLSRTKVLSISNKITELLAIN